MSPDAPADSPRGAVSMLGSAFTLRFRESSPVSLAASPAVALDPRFLSARSAPILTWQIENGLPQNSVQASAATARRLHLDWRPRPAWRGSTASGSSSSTGPTLPALVRENIRALAEDRDGAHLDWAPTPGCSATATATFTRLGTADGLPCERVRALLVDRDGLLWVATERGLCRLRMAVFVRGEPARRPAEVPPRIRQTPDGALWFPGSPAFTGCATAGWTGSGWRRAARRERSTTSSRGAAATVLGRDAPRCRPAVDGRRFARSDLPAGIAGDSVHAIWEDASGVLWLGLERRGLVRGATGQRRGLRQGAGLLGQLRHGVRRGPTGEPLGRQLRRGSHLPARDAVLGVRRGARGCRPTTCRASSRRETGPIWIGMNGGGVSASRPGG